MVHRGIVDIRTKGIIDFCQFVSVGNLQDAFPAFSAVRDAVKFQIERLFK